MNDLQQKIFEIFLEVKNICDKNNIRYFAIGGTCLGAVRHKGFIPWDDDLDIAMPDKDFNKFMDIAPNLLPEHLRLLKVGELNHSTYLMAKIHNIKTTFIEKVELPYKDSYKGVYIDIMPFCGVPDNKIKRKWLYMKLHCLWKLHYKKRGNLEDSKTIQGKLLWLLMKPINCIVPMDFYCKLWMKEVFKRQFDSNKYTGFLWAPCHPYDNLILDISWFRKYIDLPFENTTIRCPVGWQNYLALHYGDYMQFPPKIQRVPVHGGGIIDINNSYTYYL